MLQSAITDNLQNGLDISSENVLLVYLLCLWPCWSRFKALCSYVRFLQFSCCKFGKVFFFFILVLQIGRFFHSSLRENSLSFSLANFEQICQKNLCCCVRSSEKGNFLDFSTFYEGISCIQNQSCHFSQCCYWPLEFHQSKILAILRPSFPPHSQTVQRCFFRSTLPTFLVTKAVVKIF